MMGGVHACLPDRFQILYGGDPRLGAFVAGTSAGWVTCSARYVTTSAMMAGWRKEDRRGARRNNRGRLPSVPKPPGRAPLRPKRSRLCLAQAANWVAQPRHGV